MQVERLNWAGHVVRMLDKRIPRRVLEGSLEDDLPEGRGIDGKTTCGMMAPNCSVRKNWHIAARRGSEWTKRMEGGGHGQETGRRAVGGEIIIINISSSSDNSSSSSSSSTYSGANPGFARPEAYTILGVLFTKNNTKLSKK